MSLDNYLPEPYRKKNSDSEFADGTMQCEAVDCDSTKAKRKLINLSKYLFDVNLILCKKHSDMIDDFFEEQMNKGTRKKKKKGKTE